MTWRQRQWLRLSVGMAAFLVGLTVAVGDGGGGRPVLATVVLAAADLPAGRSLRPADLIVAQLPADAAPPGASAEAAAVVGATLISPIAAGEAVTATRILGQNDAGGGLRGRTAMPVVLADAGVLPYLRPGQRVDVLWAPTAQGPADADSSAKVVAADVAVLVVPQPAARDGPFADGGTAVSDGTVILEVDEDSAIALASAAANGRLSVLLRGG